MRNRLIIGQPIDIKKVFMMSGVNDTTGNYQFYDNKGQIVNRPLANVDNRALVNLLPKILRRT